jgi:hypothetical protein
LVQGIATTIPPKKSAEHHLAGKSYVWPKKGVPYFHFFLAVKCFNPLANVAKQLRSSQIYYSYFNDFHQNLTNIVSAMILHPYKAILKHPR